MFDSVHQSWADRSLAALRIMTALVFLQHGLQKMFSFPVPPVAGYQHLSLAGLAGLMEVIATPFLLVGWFTRPVSFVMSGLMAFAYFMGHAGKGFFPLANGGDVAVLCCFIFLYLSAAGGGAWSVDGTRGAGGQLKSGAAGRSSPQRVAQPLPDTGD